MWGGASFFSLVLGTRSQILFIARHTFPTLFQIANNQNAKKISGKYKLVRLCSKICF